MNMTDITCPAGYDCSFTLHQAQLNPDWTLLGVLGILALIAILIMAVVAYAIGSEK